MAIKEVEKIPKNEILYDKFINEHNHIKRAKKLVENVYRIVDDFKAKEKFLITDKKETSDEKSEYDDQEIAEQLLMCNEDINYISKS